MNTKFPIQGNAVMAQIPERTQDVPEAVGRLTSNIDHLFDQIARLHDRLTPVLEYYGESTDSPDNAGQKVGYNVPLADDINRAANSIDQITVRVVDMLNRLGL